SRGLPLRVFSAISSCVPATSSDIETPNAAISPAEVIELAAEPDVLALGEVMDFQGLAAGDDHLTAMVAAAHESGLSVEGHVPSLTGPDLSRYVAFGVRSDHTLMTAPKLLEQLRKGQWVMVQEKSVTEDVVGAVMGLPDRSRVMLITDDVMPNRLLTGHLDRIVSLAVERGWDPLDAIAAATLRPATYLGLSDLGLVAPGALADFVVTEGLAAYPPRQVYVGGRLVAEDGATVVASSPSPQPSAPDGLAQAFDPAAVLRSWFELPASGSVRARVIVTNERNSFTTLDERGVEVAGGVPTDEDLSLATVVPRARLRPGAAPHEPVVGLVAGLGLRRGAFATTFAHDSHNLFVLGRDPDAMLTATRAVLRAGGGMAFAPAGDAEPLLLSLPLAGLLSDDPVAEVAQRFDAIERALVAAGMRHLNPLLLLTLLPPSVSPDYRLTDRASWTCRPAWCCRRWWRRDTGSGRSRPCHRRRGPRPRRAGALDRRGRLPPRHPMRGPEPQPRRAGHRRPPLGTLPGGGSHRDRGRRRVVHRWQRRQPGRRAAGRASRPRAAGRAHGHGAAGAGRAAARGGRGQRRPLDRPPGARRRRQGRRERDPEAVRALGGAGPRAPAHA